ncbi:thiamine-phosphate kinase [Hugenholtzia roseola]|uniref:thiamine-phosphate kinase n=1 Tax=Hugenholtzia roseola TaxID=1002 RepID=UPI000422F9DF|nr:thiamine-phosphate kinase [Hugenholtzia roseola]
MSRTELNQLGEFGLIEHLKSTLPPAQVASTLLGIGDDAAVIALSDTESLLFAADMLIEGVHFDLAYTPLQHLGYKAVAVNVSDMAAMNGVAQQITVSLGVSNRFPLEAMEELYAGMAKACTFYGVDLVGGDTTTSPAGLVISISVIGRAAKNAISYRKNAKPNDILCLSGDLGAAYLGLQILVREKEVFQSTGQQPELEPYSYVVGRQLKPEARVDVVKELAQLGIIPTAMIDISDGLASEILHLCKASQVGMVLYEENLPLHENSLQTAEELNLSLTTCALHGGEDYELLFTISQKDYEKAQRLTGIYFIGFVTEAEWGANLHTRAGEKIALQAQGWTHF